MECGLVFVLECLNSLVDSKSTSSRLVKVGQNPTKFSLTVFFFQNLDVPFSRNSVRWGASPHLFPARDFSNYSTLFLPGCPSP